ncbi:MAG: IS630 family transposase [bacterium]
MEKIDARKHDQKTQYEIRKQVIRLRKQGVPNKTIAEGLGITQQHSSKIWKLYVNQGDQAIKPGKRGRRSGEKRSLTSEQETELQKLLVDHAPDQFKLPFALWTREVVQLLIKKRYRLDMPIRTVGEYLKRWGFTPQKPVKRAYEQRPIEVQKWLDETYPEIKKRAKAEHAEISWCDETGIQTAPNRERGYAPKGVTPVAKFSAKKTRISMISAITNEGQVRFMLYGKSMNSDLLIAFMKRLIKAAGRKVFLVMDNLRVHHCSTVKEWLEKHKEDIEVFYLPAYSPDLNPDEYLNNNLKNRVHSGLPARTERDLMKKTRSFMKRLQRRPHHVKNYFKHPKIAYAA